MMLLSRRFASIALFSAGLLEQQASIAFVPSSLAKRTLFATHVFMVAPGVQVDSPEDIQNALSMPETTVVDVRGLDEILASGYFKSKNQWVHAPCSVEECPLLSVAAEGLIRSKTAPVVVYCASGRRATKAKEFLQSMGYKHVLNAGGYPGDMSFLK